MLPRMLLVALRCIRHPVKELQPVIHTSILPPTRASKGGRGLSFSLFSCRRDCLRPPTKNKTKCTVRRTSSVSPCAQLDISVIHNHLCENVSLLSVSHLKSIIIFRWRYWWVFFFSPPTFRPLLEIFILVLGPHGVLRLIVWKIILPLWATHQRETVHCIRFCWWPPGGAMALQITTDHYSWACTYCTTCVLWKWGESRLLCQTITLNLECALSRDGLWNLYTLTVSRCWTVAISTSTPLLKVQLQDICLCAIDIETVELWQRSAWEDNINARDTREL